MKEDQLIRILELELVKALGCTEPIAIAYASATARKHLGGLPEQITVACSGNIIKNAKAVVVPMTGGLRGIEAAAAAGAAGGSPEKGLEVLTTVTEEALQKGRKMLFDQIDKSRTAGSGHLLPFLIGLRPLRRLRRRR